MPKTLPVFLLFVIIVLEGYVVFILGIAGDPPKLFRLWAAGQIRFPLLFAAVFDAAGVRVSIGRAV